MVAASVVRVGFGQVAVVARLRNLIRGLTAAPGNVVSAFQQFFDLFLIVRNDVGQNVQLRIVEGGLHRVLHARHIADIEF